MSFVRNNIPFFLTRSQPFYALGSVGHNGHKSSSTPSRLAVGGFFWPIHRNMRNSVKRRNNRFALYFMALFSLYYNRCSSFIKRLRKDVVYYATGEQKTRAHGRANALASSLREGGELLHRRACRTHPRFEQCRCGKDIGPLAQPRLAFAHQARESMWPFQWKPPAPSRRWKMHGY